MASTSVCSFSRYRGVPLPRLGILGMVLQAKWLPAAWPLTSVLQCDFPDEKPQITTHNGKGHQEEAVQ